jgi:hypothetical protein
VVIISADQGKLKSAKHAGNKKMTRYVLDYT